MKLVIEIIEGPTKAYASRFYIIQTHQLRKKF